MSKKVTAILAVVIYLASAGTSYFLFSGESVAEKVANPNVPTAPSGDNDYEAITFDQNAPKTEECPLNGAKYSKDQRAWWEKHRPLGVMVENHLDSRPQSGLNAADVVYEIVAEGGITRFLAIYHCNDAGIVGPVRSARTYFLDFMSEYGEFPLYAHVGGANTPGPADALGQINDYGWGQYNDLSQFSIGFPTFRRDESRLGREVATEHTMYSVTNKLWDFAKGRKLTDVDKNGDSWDADFVKYSFKEEVAPDKRPAAQSIRIGFWDNAGYVVDWTYNKERNEYLRKNGGVDHIDRNTKKQLTAKNVVVLSMSEGNANDGYPGNAHLLYGTKGSGSALIFMDGKQTKGTWKKASRTGRTTLVDSSGKEIKLNRGKIWFEIQATDGTVIVK